MELSKNWVELSGIRLELSKFGVEIFRIKSEIIDDDFHWWWPIDQLGVVRGKKKEIGIGNYPTGESECRMRFGWRSQVEGKTIDSIYFFLIKKDLPHVA